jgi:hypothetical protein
MNDLILSKATKKATSKWRDPADLVKDDQLRNKLNILVDDALKEKAKIQLSNQTIKQLRETAAEMGIMPQMFNTWLAMAFNNDYTQRRDNLSKQLDLIDIVMGNGGGFIAPTSKDDE